MNLRINLNLATLVIFNELPTYLSNSTLNINIQFLRIYSRSKLTISSTTPQSTHATHHHDPLGGIITSWIVIIALYVSIRDKHVN